MSQPHSNREIEIKLSLKSAAAGNRLLKQAGFKRNKRRVFEANTVFDTPGQSLYQAGALLRVRTVESLGILTYKGPATLGKHKSREELEVEISDPRTMEEILARLGFRPVFRYEKFRSEHYQPESSGLIMLDETPVGVFLELEGEPEWIDRTARTLGFSEADYITDSYRTLYLQFCRREHIRPGDMVFVKTPRIPNRSHAGR